MGVNTMLFKLYGSADTPKQDIVSHGVKSWEERQLPETRRIRQEAWFVH